MGPIIQDWKERNIPETDVKQTRVRSYLYECISARGRTLPPFVIFKGKYHQFNWFTPETIEDAKDWLFATSPSGWSDGDLGVRWLERLFDRFTSNGLRENQWRMLILGGHESHITAEFISYCVRNRIVALCLPPHSTHRLQPLDVVSIQYTASSTAMPSTMLCAMVSPASTNNYSLNYWYKLEPIQFQLDWLRQHGLELGWYLTILTKYSPSYNLSRLVSQNCQNHCQLNHLRQSTHIQYKKPLKPCSLKPAYT
ncbi:hypothetical protein ABW20_dc0106854 [Dactylellina cionopaga]|nr:hypothetical protein ABW20_dc0106854 [Dactylellina cionopaga]